MENLTEWITSGTEASSQLCQSWQSFLQLQDYKTTEIKKIDFAQFPPVITDFQNRKFQIDFVHDKLNFQKKKGSLKTELIGKAMGAGRYGLKVLDLSAGLGIDALFLSQMGYQVTAIERNPVIYLALNTAREQLPPELQKNIQFLHGHAQDYLRSSKDIFDVTYFDPMFPEKKKSALAKQEMMFFRHLVGPDDDSSEVIDLVLKMKLTKRLVIKRPLKSEPLHPRPSASIKGKLIRFDIYGV